MQDHPPDGKPTETAGFRATGVINCQMSANCSKIKMLQKSGWMCRRDPLSRGQDGCIVGNGRHTQPPGRFDKCGCRRRNTANKHLTTVDSVLYWIRHRQKTILPSGRCRCRGCNPDQPCNTIIGYFNLGFKKLCPTHTASGHLLLGRRFGWSVYLVGIIQRRSDPLGFQDGQTNLFEKIVVIL